MFSGGKNLRFAAAALAASACASWALGTVISSFKLSEQSEPYATGIYAGPSYICVIFYSSGQDYIYRYTRDGSFIAAYPINGTNWPTGGDASHLGAGYVSLVDQSLNRVFLFSSSGGTPVASFAVSSPSGGALADLMWTGTYYEVTGITNTGRFNRYNSGGAFMGQVTYGGWPGAMTGTGGVAYAPVANGRTGSYLVASPRSNGQPNCILNISGSGSFVASYTLPQQYGTGACVGESTSPGYWGDADWLVWVVPSAIWCLQVDIGGRDTTAVTPASLGKVKAIYR